MSPLPRWLAPRAFLDALRTRLGIFRSGRQLERLMARAAGASAEFRPQYYLRAAQVAAALGRSAEALSLYGQAIDGFLASGRGKAAEVACRQVIERYPDVIRARRTLALLAYGRGEAEKAAELLREYIVSSRGGDERVLSQSLRLFALLSDSGPLRDAALAGLRSIGDEEGIDHALHPQEEREPELFARETGRWPRALQAALLGPEKLRELSI